MYSEGLADLNEMFILYPFDPPGVKEANIALMREKATNRYFPAFEKVCRSCLDFKIHNNVCGCGAMYLLSQHSGG